MEETCHYISDVGIVCICRSVTKAYEPLYNREEHLRISFQRLNALTLGGQGMKIVCTLTLEPNDDEPPMIFDLQSLHGHLAMSHVNVEPR